MSVKERGSGSTCRDSHSFPYRSSWVWLRLNRNISALLPTVGMAMGSAGAGMAFQFRYPLLSVKEKPGLMTGGTLEASMQRPTFTSPTEVVGCGECQVCLATSCRHSTHFSQLSSFPPIKPSLILPLHHIPLPNRIVVRSFILPSRFLLQDPVLPTT